MINPVNMKFESNVQALIPKIPDKYETINRLILVGNGFDLAHGLKSSFKDFIFDYCVKSIECLTSNLEYQDPLIQITVNAEFISQSNFSSNLLPSQVFDYFLSIQKNSKVTFKWKSIFFKSVINEIDYKNWVDIEIQYFHYLKQRNTLNNSEIIRKLNLEFEFIKTRFLDYLTTELKNNNFSTNSELVAQFEQIIKLSDVIPNTIRNKKKPKRYCILNFNYTDIAEKYGDELNVEEYRYIPIHGQLDADNINAQGPVFGYGDELDKDYLNFELQKDDAIFEHIKSFKYLQFKHYRNLIEFIDNHPYQVQIFGHSCGLSDRTLLSTIFEHSNCISIKTFYHQVDDTDDFEQKTYSISRHFKSKSELRVKVVNKKFCESMIQPIKL